MRCAKGNRVGSSSKGGSVLKQGVPMRRFWPYVMEYRGQIVIGLILMIFMVVLDVVQPLPLKILFDNVIGKHPMPIFLQPVEMILGYDWFNLLIFVCALVIVIAAVDGVVTYLGEIHVKNLGQRVIFNLRCDLYTHIHELSLSFHERRRTGDMVARLTSDIQLVQEMVVSSLFVLVTNSLTLVGMVVVMLLIDWRLTLLAMGIMPFLFYVIYHYTLRIKRLARDQRKREGHVASLAQESISSMRIVQAYVAEKREISRFEEISRKSMESSILSTRLEAAFVGIIALCIAIGTSAIMYLGVTGVKAGRLTPGGLIVFLAYLVAMYRPMRNLSKLTNTLSKATAASERIVEIFDTQPDIRDAPDAKNLHKVQGFVEFDHVDFDYDPAHPVLRDISFNVEPGEKIALVGSTGAGKSTIMALLLRFYDPRAGCVRIDGMDLRNVRIASIRSQVSIVLQEAVLFRTTIRENIAYSRPDATLEEVIAAAKAAQAHEFILQLPEGYDTVIGERGSTLSGGERQRIAIARAILKAAPIVVLDEPTTALDAESEALVLCALEELTRGRTTFTISHRLSTVRNVDRILVIERGRIVESGTHEELLAHRGRYSDLYRMQVIATQPPQAEPPQVIAVIPEAEDDED